MKKKKTALIILLLVLAIVIYYVFTSVGPSLTESEKNQALTNILGRKPNLSSSAKGYNTYKDKFVSFSYPASAVIYNYRDPYIKNNSSSLAVFSFDLKQPRLVFYYAVTDFGKIGNISDIPDVRFRQVEKSAYSQKEEFVGGKNGLVFERKEQNGTIEKSAFFLVNEKSYSFSITGSDKNAIEDLYKSTLASLRFL